MEFKFNFFQELDSTNIYAKNMAKNGACEGLCIIADSQTNGYGRMGRNFHSPESTGLYMSLVLRPKIKPQDALLITTAAAVAVSNAIDKISGKASFIKWVNDIFIDGKKVCGILCESAIDIQSGLLDYCILGIGINLTDPKNGFPEDIKDIAGSVFGNECTNNAKEELISLILSNFDSCYRDLTSKNFYPSYKQKCFIIGKKVAIIKNGIPEEHTVCDVNNDFKLITKNQNGDICTLDSGEVSLKWNI